MAVVAVVAVTTSIGATEWARSVAASIEQARATVAAAGSLGTENLHRIAEPDASRAPAFAPLAAAGDAAPEPRAEEGSVEPSTERLLDERASYPAGPPTAGQILELLESGLIPDDEDGAAILRDTLAAPAP